MMRPPEKTLALLQPELDPDNAHGTAKLWAALKSIGVEPEDVEPGFTDKAAPLHDKVPKNKAATISSQRKDIREGLRRSRLEQVRVALEELDGDDVRRFARTAYPGPGGGGSGLGVRPLVSQDLPPVDAIDGVAEFKAVQERQMQRVKDDQARKANMICVDFLTGKKRAEEADARVEALNQRLKEYKLEQDRKTKEKRILAQKAEEKRASTVARARQERAEYEDELQQKAEDRLAKARERRAQNYSTEALTQRMSGSNAKREAAYQESVRLQEETLAKLEKRSAETEERLYQRNCEVAEQMEQRRQDSQARFLQKQVAVEAMKLEWATTKLADHKAFSTKVHDSRQRGTDFMKDRSKSTGDLKKKATDKWRTNYERLMNQKASNDEELLAKHARATDYVENVHKPMKWKCGCDVFSHLEVKEKTFGDLQQRRLAELKKAQNARTLAACIRVAEQDARDDAKKAGQAQLQCQRVESKKAILKYSQETSEVFRRIQSEPNEAKVRSAMLGLGFKMPSLGGEDEEAEAS